MRERPGPRVVAAAGALVLAPFLSGCGTLGTEYSLGAAQVRFVEVSPGSPDMDFYVNGTGAAYGVGYQSFTSYLPVTPGPSSLTVNRAGMGQSVAAAQSNLVGGRQYTAIVSHGLGNLQEHVYADQETPAAAGQIAVRVLNEVEGTGAMTAYVSLTGASTATPSAVLNVASGAASTYLDMPAGSYTITATVAERGLNIPVGSVTVKAGSGAVRTVVFAGTAPAGTHAAVSGFTLTDVDAETGLPASSR